MISLRNPIVKEGRKRKYRKFLFQVERRGEGNDYGRCLKKRVHLNGKIGELTRKVSE